MDGVRGVLHEGQRRCIVGARPEMGTVPMTAPAFVLTPTGVRYSRDVPRR
jgi:hypothetical protein